MAAFFRTVFFLVSLFIAADCLAQAGDDYFLVGESAGLTPYSEKELPEKLKLVDAGKDAEAMTMLGRMYYTGTGITQDKRKGQKLLEQAADQLNYPQAQYALAMVYVDQQQYRQALPYLYKAGEKKYGPALYELGLFHENGIEVFADQKKALNYYQAADEAGELNGTLKTALFYRDGRGIEPDLRKAIQYFESASAKNQEKGFQLKMAMTLTDLYRQVAAGEQDQQQIFKWQLKAAEMGRVESQVYVADAYLNGTGVPQSNENAIAWYQKIAAIKTDQQFRPEVVRAMTQLGTIYANGIGVDLDYKKAMEWYKAAAERGGSEAAWNIGAMYSNGNGVQPDQAESNKWFKRAEALREKEKQ